MAEYSLAPAAEHDLVKIAKYTIETWGLEQCAAYEAALASCFKAISRGEARSTMPIPRRPDLRVTRCRHHYVFFLHEENAGPLILAVLHENMDLMARLRDRLDAG